MKKFRERHSFSKELFIKFKIRNEKKTEMFLRQTKKGLEKR